MHSGLIQNLWLKYMSQIDYIKPLDHQYYTNFNEIFLMFIVIDPPGGVLPSKGQRGMCRWMGSHFHNWIDYNGVTFLVELPEWGRTFSKFLE